MLKRFFMAIKGRRNIKGEDKTSPNVLNQQEVDFIISKMRQANYKGVEFEQYYFILEKLQKIIK
jgi:hypothetical protein